MELEIHDPKFFNSIVNIFSTKMNSVFTINSELFQISAFDSHYYFISLEEKFFHFPFDEIIFGLNTTLLHKQLQLIQFLEEKQKQLHILLENNSFIIKKLISDHTNLEITVPFIKIEEYHLDQTKESRTKFFMKDGKSLLSFIGIVQYTIENNNLIITRESEESKEEIEIFDIEFLKNDYILDFTCSNSWVNVFWGISDYVTNIYFEFTDDVLHVSFSLKNYERSYFEVRVPRCIT